MGTECHLFQLLVLVPSRFRIQERSSHPISRIYPNLIPNPSLISTHSIALFILAPSRSQIEIYVVYRPFYSWRQGHLCLAVFQVRYSATCVTIH